MNRLILLAVGLVFALNIAGAAGEGKVKASIAGPEKPAAGKAFELMVELEITEGYHIQSNTAKDPWIPTKLSITAPEGFKVGDPVFPSAKTIDSFGEKLQAFEG